MKKKIALITGAGAGIGMALAYQMATKNFIVYAGVRDLRRAKKEYDLTNPDIHLIELDVNNQAQIQRCIKKILKTSGQLDVLINNAGYGMYGAFEEMTAEQIHSQMQTNYFGCLRMCRAVIGPMKAQQSGKIFNIGSILGLQALPTGTAYTSSKFALEGFSESLRYELFVFGIDVVLIEPGLVRTNFKKNMELTQNHNKPSSDYDFLNKRIDTHYRGLSISAESAAIKITKIILKKNPGIRYRIGLDSKLVYLIRSLVPEFIRDWLIKSFIRSKLK